jgi:hypothetical protein
VSDDRVGHARPATDFLPTRRSMAVGLALLAIAGAPALAQHSPRAPEAPVKIEIRSEPIEAFDPRDPSRQRFGKLQFRGGLVLTSPYKEFGGLSSLRLEPDGARFIMVSDKGRWLKGRILYRDDRPIGIAEAVMAPVLGRDGKPLAARGWYDTESIADDGGRLYVGIERVHRIVRFDYGKHGLLARGRPIEVPAAMRKLPSNKSIEALVKIPKGEPLAGTLIAFSERGLDAQGDHLAFLIGGRRPGTFALKRRDNFDVSDAALLPKGDLLVLERKYSALSGVAIRIRRVALAGLAPGALVDGTIIFTADLNDQVDNMEGLALHRDAGGAMVLTMISDDNFSALQRTLLLQFTLVEE